MIFEHRTLGSSSSPLRLAALGLALCLYRTAWGPRNARGLCTPAAIRRAISCPALVSPQRIWPAPRRQLILPRYGSCAAALTVGVLTKLTCCSRIIQRRQRPLWLLCYWAKASLYAINHVASSFIVFRRSSRGKAANCSLCLEVKLRDALKALTGVRISKVALRMNAPAT